MKNLKEYLETYCPEIIAKNNYYWEQALEFFNNEVPQKYVELYENEELLTNDFIFETLSSHDAEKLKKCLKKHWGDKIWFSDYTGDKTKSFYMILDNDLNLYDFKRNPNADDADIKNLEKFENILSFFNYYVSFSRIMDDNYALFIEPRYSDDISNKIYNEHFYLYHFTDKESAKSILKNGLRCKKGSYRVFPERIFLYATKTKLDINDENVNNFILKVVNRYKLNEHGLSILRISNNNKFKIYKDTAMKESEAVFTYENIPPEYIKEIK